MSTKHATAAAVAALFTAAGRNYADVELLLYHRMLDRIDDDVLAEAVDAIIRDIDLGARAPSPALVLDSARGVLRRRAERDADARGLVESTGAVLPPTELASRMRALRESMHVDRFLGGEEVGRSA